MMTLEKDLAIAESNLRTAQNMLAHVKMMAERGYVSALEVEERSFAVTRAELSLGVKKTEIEVLKNFTKAIELETLRGNLKASTARHEADKERAQMDAERRDLALVDLEHCVIKADRSGLVIYPSAEPWKYVPEIEEGATVYMGQTLLLMPDLSKMQVKVGIHESFIDRIKPGLATRVTLPDKTLEGEVSSVALITSPAGWWTGNVVKYDTIITLPSVQGLKPGMSAEIEVIIDRHENVLTIPVAAVVETAQGDFCWVKTASGSKRRLLKLGDTNNVFTVVKAGLNEGDEVVLHPFAFEEAQTEDLKPHDEAKSRRPESAESPGSGTKPKSPLNKQKSKPQAAKSKQAESKPTTK
jgi:multidrug efflux pump subunit AcrA (membrane-fusion protein)